MDQSGVWYFAYGSNLDPDRFRGRVGSWTERRPAILRGWQLRFSGEVTSEGGGGAVIEPERDAAVYGGIYRLSRAQIAQLDAVEIASAMNPQQRGERITIRVDSSREQVEAEVYVVPRPQVYRAPSERYLDHILTGLRSFEYGAEILDRVRRQAADEPTDGAWTEPAERLDG